MVINVALNIVISGPFMNVNFEDSLSVWLSFPFKLQVEYDLENSGKDDIRLLSTDRIEQSAVPQCMTWYPPITKEHFIVTASDQVREDGV